MSVVQFHLWPPANNYLYQYFNLNKSCFISRTNQVLQGSTSCILGYKPSTKFYISSTKCLHPHHPYGVPPYLVFLRETQSPEKNPGNQLLQEYGDFTWRVYDFEELVGGYLQGIIWLALPLKILFEEENSLHNSKMRFYLKVLMSDFLKV